MVRLAPVFAANQPKQHTVRSLARKGYAVAGAEAFIDKETDTVRLFVNEGFSAGDGVPLAGQGSNRVLLWLVSGENGGQANHALALVPIALSIIEAQQPPLRVDVA